MQSVQTTEPATIHPPQRFEDGIRPLSKSRVLILLALLLIGAGMALGWGWLTAIGIAPILVAVAPCAAMRALGLCMNRMGLQSYSTDPATGSQSASEGARTSDAPETKSNPT